MSEKIAEATFRAYFVGFDQNQFRLQALVDVIRKVIPEFSLGYYEGTTVPLTDVVDKLKEAAETVYLTDKYQTRGEFGELILHLLLRDFCGSTPLISKIWFKDSHNVPIHGFDGVHVTELNREKKLWLGESKLYKSGAEGVKDLAGDLANHLRADYLRKEFALISRKLPAQCPDIDHWRELLDKHTTLDKIFSKIVIPMVCTYTSKMFDGHNKNTNEFLRSFEKECRGLRETFSKAAIQTDCDVILMLLPVPCKDKLNSELDARLKRMQGI